MDIAKRPIQVVFPLRPLLRDLGFWFVLFTLAGTTLLHYLTDIHLIPSHSVYRSLYYVPIAVAAVRYGRRGGVLTALNASALYLPHVLLSWQTMPNDGFNDLLENVIFLFVGAFAGSLADAERRQRQRAQDAVTKLAVANTELQSHMALTKRMHALLASILESIDSGVITLDDEGQVTTTNRAANALLGWTENMSARLPPPIADYLATHARGYRQIVLAGRTLGLHGSPLVGAQGETIGTVLVLDDLTELRALEEQIQRAQRLAALGRLAGGLAHEIRNPLGITRAAAQVLQRELGEYGPLGEYTEVIQTEIDRVDRLIEQLLNYAQPLPIQHGSVDLAVLLDRTLALTRAYAARYDITLTADITEDLPLIEGDAELLHQALVNLLLNGIQATAPGGTVGIHARSLRASYPFPTRIMLSISDTGQGIAPDDLPRIFDPFFTTRDDGIGLGLSIVQQIVHEHHGSIEVESHLGGGTTFVVQLPGCPHL